MVKQEDKLDVVIELTVDVIIEDEEVTTELVLHLSLLSGLKKLKIFAAIGTFKLLLFLLAFIGKSILEGTLRLIGFLFTILLDLYLIKGTK